MGLLSWIWNPLRLFKRRRSPPSVVPYRQDGKSVAIVFVHGFSGNAEETWKDLTAQLKLRHEIDGWDLIGVGYPTSLRIDVPYVWAADPGLDLLAKHLVTALSTGALANYRQIALVAHSMGGLICQRAILDSKQIRSRLSDLILFGTPSNGLAKSIAGYLFKRQSRDMMAGGRFIRRLRSDWGESIQGNCSFRFAAVAGLRDEFVGPATSLSCFPEANQRIVDGNHVEMIRPSSPTDPICNLIVTHLLGQYRPGFVETHLIAIERGDFRDAVESLLPHAASLDDNALVMLALGLEELDRRDEALAVLQQYLGNGSRTSSEVLSVLAGRMKRLWLNTRDSGDFSQAKSLYLSALDDATAANHKEQIYYSAINLAFLCSLETARDSSPGPDAVNYAEVARRNALQCKRTVWSIATLAEAALILDGLEVAAELYSEAVPMTSSPREKNSMYSQAILLSGWLFGGKGVQRIESVFGIDV